MHAQEKRKQWRSIAVLMTILESSATDVKRRCVWYLKGFTRPSSPETQNTPNDCKKHQRKISKTSQHISEQFWPQHLCAEQQRTAEQFFQQWTNISSSRFAWLVSCVYRYCTFVTFGVNETSFCSVSRTELLKWKTTQERWWQKWDVFLCGIDWEERTKGNCQEQEFESKERIELWHFVMWKVVSCFGQKFWRKR